MNRHSVSTTEPRKAIRETFRTRHRRGLLPRARREYDPSGATCLRPGPFMARATSLLLLLTASTSFGATIAVTTTADSGPGSLRQALLDAASGNCPAPCTIE